MRCWSEGDRARIGAIDAGSNAVRLAIADVDRDGSVHVVARHREPIRLGQRVFRDGLVGRKRRDAVVRAFRRFSRMLDDYEVSWYRAVATSALRNADDRRFVLRAIRKQTGIEMDTIPGADEATYVRSVVLDAFPVDEPPTVIADLGGGSLEITVMNRLARRRAHAVLPLGAVRLMHEYDLSGRFSKRRARRVRDHVMELIEDALGAPPAQVRSVAICGGNAKALARVAPGDDYRDMSTVDLDHLAQRFNRMRKRDLHSRMQAYGVRKDRADVMPVAAMVYGCVGQWLGVDRMIAPAVGLVDGLLQDMAAALAEQRMIA